MKNLLMKQPQERIYGVTWRSLAIGMILMPLNCYWVMQIELVWYSGHPTCASIFYNAVFSVLVLIFLNLFLRKVFKKSLSQGELLAIYVMLNLASAIASHDMLQILIPALPAAFFFATPENEWREQLFRYIPRWLTVDDKSVARGFYEGGTNFNTIENISGWLVPIIAWSTFILALIFVMICINVTVRKQWAYEEKLSYPMVQLPLMLTQNKEASDFFKNRMMWIGFAIAAAIDVLNGISFFYPKIPTIPVKLHNFSQFFTERPWNAVNWTRISFYPFIIGLTFFMPLSLSFSCWFFFLFRQAELIFGSILGMKSLPLFPYLDAQATGAWIGLTIIVLFISRRHLLKFFLKVFSKSDFDDSNEPMRYRWTFVGIIGGMIFITLFCLKAGMSVFVILAFFAIYFGTSLAITRMRAELGPPSHEHLIHADRALIDILGTRRLGPGNLTMFSFFQFITLRLRSHPMPLQLEGFKLAEKSYMDSRKLVFAMLLATLVGALSGFWSLLHMSYKRVSTVSWGYWTFNRLQWLLNYPKTPNSIAMGFMGIGIIFTFFLMFMRMRFLWWPFHPLGYALSCNFGLEYYWFCIVISSTIKWIILRYGGLGAHRKATPFFLGLVLGEFTVGGFWSAVSVIFQTRTYTFWIF